MSAPDLLFAVRNNYYLGAYQHAISEASDLESLDDADKLERDIFVYRSYIELGSYEVQPCHPLQVPRSLRGRSRTYGNAQIDARWRVFPRKAGVRPEHRSSNGTKFIS